MEAPQFPRENSESVDETLFQKRSRFCCFPCFETNESSSVGLKWWQKARTGEIESNGSLWSRGVAAVKKIREWSELAAGPRWKTFIRRFNRNRSGSNRHVNFQYDPLSYAMNFDEGPGQNGHFDAVEDEEYFYSRNFSSRYAKGSMDLGKEGPTFA